jgi:translation initiation factor IF-2
MVQKKSKTETVKETEEKKEGVIKAPKKKKEPAKEKLKTAGEPSGSVQVTEPAEKAGKKPRVVKKKAEKATEQGLKLVEQIKAEVKLKKEKAAAAKPHKAEAEHIAPVTHEHPVKEKAVKKAAEHKVETHEKPQVKHPEAAAPKKETKVHVKPQVHVPAKPAEAAAPSHKAPAAQQPVAAPKPAAQPVKPEAAPAVAPVPEVKKELKDLSVNELTNIRELAEKMKVPTGDLIKKLISLGTLVSINQRLDFALMELLSSEYGYKARFVSIYEDKALEEEVEDPSQLKPRSPVVTIMGHVDHGKTSLLDAIRSSDVAAGEAGGITQHIGAYKVKTPKGEITFLDTPGHEAFTAMRSRGAQCTDIVVLVVAADDGIMPQTVEAIDHARAAAVPIIVAINKIDIQGANPAQVKQELTKYNLVPEDWGGDTICVEVSAKNKINIEALLEMILLKAEMMELKANPDRPAKGIVIEAKLDHQKGPLVTTLINKGTLKVGDNYIVGTTYGKVRAMRDDHGQRLESARPGTPVELLGTNELPRSGDMLIVVDDERQAREIATNRNSRAREESLRPVKHLSLEDISSGKVKELRVVVKADVQGSLEAVKDSFMKLSTAEITLRIIHGGVGSINESDVTLAAASDALIIGFNIRPESAIERMADKEGVSIKIYRIIYEAIDEVKAAMEGLLEPEYKQVTIGRVIVKQMFKITNVGMVAGCMVSEGKVTRGAKVRVLRDNVIVHEGTITSLRRFKDDVKEVEKGFECGVTLDKFTDLKPGDVLEAYIQEKVARKL